MKLFALIFSLLLVTSVNAQQIPNRSVTSLKMHSSAGNSKTDRNLGLKASVSSNALTISLAQADGSSNPSANFPVDIVFRDATATNGGYVTRSVTSSLSVTISNGSTLGHSSNANNYIYVYAFDNGGTVVLGAGSYNYLDYGAPIGNCTAEGGAGAADANSSIYCTSSVSSKPYKVIGRITSNQTAAGTWAAAPTKIEVGNFQIPAAGYVGQAFWPSTANCSWSQSTGTTLTDFAADTDCPNPTIDTGFLTAAATKVPWVVVPSAAPGRWIFRWKLNSTCSGGGAGQGRIRATDGTNTGPMLIVGGSDLLAYYEYSYEVTLTATQTNYTVKLQGAVLNGSGGSVGIRCETGSLGSPDMSLTVYFYPMPGNPVP